MGAERCIVLLVVVVMGTSFYVANSIIDEDIMENYSEEVAEYNELHDETLLDTEMRKRSLENRGKGVSHNDRAKRSSGQGINEDPEHDEDEQSYESVGRAVSLKYPKTIRSNGLGTGEQPERTRVARSSGQGINEDPEHDEDEQSYESEGRAVSLKDPKTIRSNGLGIGEQPERTRGARSSGQGINEDPEHDEDEQRNESESRAVSLKYPKTKRSNGLGIDEQPEQSRVARSSGQGINEDPEHDEDEQSYESEGRAVSLKYPKTKRSNGLGINEDPEHDEDERNSVRRLKSAPNMQGAHIELILENPESESRSILKELSSIGVNQYSEEDGTRGILPDLEQYEKLVMVEGFKTEYGNDGDDVSDNNNIQNPYEYFTERDEDLDVSKELSYFVKGSERIIKLNKGVDFVLGLMNSMFTGEGELTLDLPDISKKFGHGIMAGDFNATHGYFRNPASLHRTGDVDITEIGDTVSLEVALGLETLDAGFSFYDLKILKIHQAGAIDVSVVQNSIKMKISLTYSPICTVNVDYIKLEQLDGIKVNISGLGAFQSMFDMLSKWFLNNFTGDLKNIVGLKLTEKAKKSIARGDICKYFPQ